MKNLNFGSLNKDMVYSVSSIMRPGETVAATKLEYFNGGKGLNQSIALARAGAEVYHAGRIGTDGTSLTALLNENGVNTDYVSVSRSPSGHAVIQVTKEGQNSILVYGGANKEISTKQIMNVLSNFDEGDRLFLQNEINGVPALINSAARKKMEIIFNPSPIGQDIPSYPLDKISWFVVNETEAEAITGVEGSENVLAAFTKKYPNANVLLTLGENGAYCKIKNETYFQDIFHTPVVDSTAAGDTFLGYFFALLDTKGVKESLRYAAAASALAVSRKGAAMSIPTAGEVEELLADLK
jgi:ribokinase